MMISLVMFIASVAIMYLAGQLAVRRGRALKPWIWIAALIGPLAFPLLFLLPPLNAQEPPVGPDPSRPETTSPARPAQASRSGLEKTVHEQPGRIWLTAPGLDLSAAPAR
jgi:hypothetical protein